jgi:phage terminase large subunit
MKLSRKIPDFLVPLLAPNPLKGLAGGRASGKSHAFADLIIDRHMQDPSLRSVCIREVQKSIKFSSYQLIKDKILERGLSARFEVLTAEIRDRLGGGVIIFQGMQDHTADSIKSLEGFKIAWFEEAQRASKRSLDLLIPTILRVKGAECWFSWNPENADDPVEVLSRDDDFIKGFCTYLQNPFLEGDQFDLIHQQAEKLKRNDIDAYNWIWMGGYNKHSDSQVFARKYRIDEFEPLPNWTALCGLDFGFSQDPTAAVQVFHEHGKLWLYKEAVKVGLELDDTADYIHERIPDFGKHEIQADSARPESISHLKKWLPRIKGVKKWAGSVLDGIAFMRSVDEIVIHPSCSNCIDEFKLYSYKVDKRTDTILADVVDKHNHCIDAIRYAIVKLIKQKPAPSVRTL